MTYTAASHQGAIEMFQLFRLVLVVMAQHLLRRLQEGEGGVREGRTPSHRAEQWERRTRTTEAVNQAC